MPSVSRRFPRALRAASFLSLLFAVGLGARPAGAQVYSIQDLGTLGGHSSAPGVGANAINNSGQVAGVSTTGGGNNHAFLWASGNIQDLGTLGGASSEATAINSAGAVVGFSDTSDGHTHGFLWTASAGMKDIGAL